MNTENNFQHFEHKDSNAVVSFSNETTFKVGKLMEIINTFFQELVLDDLSKNLSECGLGYPPDYQDDWNKSVDAEILEPKSGEWKKGKVRMRVILEFCADEPEIKDNSIQQVNSLDDIRQTI